MATMLPFLQLLMQRQGGVPGVPGGQASAPDPSQVPDANGVSAPSAAPTTAAPNTVIPPAASPAGTAPSVTSDQLMSDLGGFAPNTPPQAKGHKLLQILEAGLQGGLAGYAQNAATYAQTGRNAGFGGGFEGAFELPFRQALQRGQLAQQGAQTELLRQQAQMIPIPGFGNVPAGLAKVMFPSLIRGQAQEAVQGQKSATAENIQGQKSTTAENIQGSRSQTAKQVAQINQGVAIPVDDTTAQLAGFPELAGQQGTRATWTNINKAIEAKGYRVQDMGKNGDDQNSGMWLMDRAGNRIKQISPNSLVFQRGASFAQNKPEVVSDPNDPGYAYFTSAANAMQNNLPSPMGAAPRAATAAARSEVPTKIGDQKVAFNTAIAHADLLRSAAKALDNGDFQTLNGLQNRFANEFGAAGPITAQTIADAYTREVTKMLSGGHLTDSEIGTIGKTIDPTKQNFSTLNSVLTAYQQLAQSKLTQLGNQEQSATKGRGPKATQAAPAATHVWTPQGLQPVKQP